MTNKIAEKIAKVLAKAQSTNSPQEAETFMAKVHQLLEDHGLEMADIAELNLNDPLGMSMKAHGSYASENWAVKLGFAAARYFGCKGVSTTSGKNHRWMNVAGRESARITFQLMMPYLVDQVRKSAAAGVKAGHFRSVSQGKTMIGNALTFRIYTLIAENEVLTEKRIGKARANDLVPLDAIAEIIKEHFPHLSEARSSKITTTKAAREYAKGISLHKQTKATAASHRIGA